MYRSFSIFWLTFCEHGESEKEKKIRALHFQTQRYKQQYSYKLQDASKPGLLKKKLLVLTLVLTLRNVLLL